MKTIKTNNYEFQGDTFENINELINWYNSVALNSDVELDRVLSEVLECADNANYNYELSGHETKTKNAECIGFKAIHSDDEDDFSKTVVF